MRIEKDDLRAAAVIRETAMRLFAERGAAAVTVREIAAAAGVSAGLVIHHYGSKDGLKDAVDRRAVAFFEEMIGESRLVERRAAARRWRTVRRPAGRARPWSTTSGGCCWTGARRPTGCSPGSSTRPRPECARWSGWSARHRTSGPGSAFLLCNDLSLVLLRRQIARSVGFDPLTRQGLGPWSAAVLDVYTSGVFAFPAAPETPGEPVPDERPTEEDQDP